MGVNPQRENGHIDIAMDIVRKLRSYRISGQEWQVLWVILEKTWGFVDADADGRIPRDKHGLPLKKKFAVIPLSAFENLTGIDRRRCHALLKQLIDKRIITKRVTNNGDKAVITYGFQKNYDEWRVSPIKRTITNNGDKVSPIMVTKLSPIMTPYKETYKENIKETCQHSEIADAKPSKKTYPDQVCRLSNLLKRLVLDNKPNRKLSTNWDDLTRTAIDRMIRIDKREPDQIHRIIEFSQQHDFWWKNILSGDKLRKQFDRLEDEIDRQSPNQQHGYRKKQISVSEALEK
jgi:hypothetical protein